MSNLLTHVQEKTNAAGQSIVTFVLVGDLDNSTVAGLEARLMPVLASRPTQLVFDLGTLKFVTSAGMRLFFMAMKQQKEHGTQVSFVNLQPQIKEVFAVMGSLPGIQIF